LSDTIKPLSRNQLIRKLINAGFSGPYPGGKHSCMVKEKHKIIIPNPHRGDMSVILVKKIIRQLGINNGEWNAL